MKVYNYTVVCLFTYANILGQNMTTNTFRVYHKCAHVSHSTEKVMCTEQLIHCKPVGLIKDQP